jgi:hypothetical protein
MQSYRPLVDALPDADAAQSPRPYPLWKKIVYGTCAVGAVVAAGFGIGYLTQSGNTNNNHNSPDHPPYDPTTPMPPIDGPLLSFDEASYVINNGSGRAMYALGDFKGYAFWAPPLYGNDTDNSYLIFPRILARTLQDAKARALQWLQQHNNTFPQAPVERGIANNLDCKDTYTPECYDPDAYDYPHLRLTDARAFYEDPFFVRTNRQTLPKATIPEDNLLAKLQQKTSANRYSFHRQPSTRQVQPGVDVSDMEMAVSDFAQSNVAKRFAPK